MRLAFALAALTIAAPAAAAGKLDSVEVIPGHVTPSAVASSASFTVTNKGSAPISRMYVICALLDEAGSPKDTKEQSVLNVPPGQSVYGSLYFNNTKEDGKLTCRVSEVN